MIEGRCQTVNHASCDVMEAIVLTVHSSSWKVRILVFENFPVPCIFWFHVLTAAKVWINFATHRYSFGFQPETEFWSLDFCRHSSQAFACSEDEFNRLKCFSLLDVLDNSAELELIPSFPALSAKLGTMAGMLCHINLTDGVWNWGNYISNQNQDNPAD
jgi:hypothetical protein